MPYAALLLFLPLITSLFDKTAKGIDNAAQGKYNKILVWLLAIAGVYFLVKGWSKSKTQAYLENAGTDKPTQQAQALRDAFNRSGIKLMMSVDGTDTDLVFRTGAEITDYAAVSDSYRTLYQAELTTDLQEELSRDDLQKFWNIVYRRTTSTNPGPVTATPSNAGKSVLATETVNVRKFENYNTVDHQAKAGELIGVYVGEIDLTVGGKKGRYVIVESPAWIFLTAKYYVFKGSVKIA